MKHYRMQEYLTKCPHCTTVFKLNQGHLDAAEGAVRCGSCLEVFNAKEHLQDQHATEALPRAANGDTVVKKESTIMRDPLAEEDDVHWTQALSNDIDKIYQYLATELDLENDPELAQNLQSDQWGRDLLAELDEELSSPSAADGIAQPVPDTEAAKKIIAKSKAAAAKVALKAAAKSKKSETEAETSTPDERTPAKPKFIKSTPSRPKSGAKSGTKPHTAEKKDTKDDAPDTPKAVGSQLPKFDDELSDHILSLPDAETSGPKFANKTQDTLSGDNKKSEVNRKSKSSTNDVIEQAQAISDEESLKAMDDWSAALLDDLKQTVDQASADTPTTEESPEETLEKLEKAKASEAAKDKEKKNAKKQSKTKKGRLPIFKGAQKIETPSEPEPKPAGKSKAAENKPIASPPTEAEPITPSFADPVGLETDTDAPLGEPAPLNDSWSNNLLAELENQSQNIADNIKQALQEQDTNSLVPEKEVSLDDLALIPLSEHNDANELTEGKNARKKSAKSKAQKSTSPQIDLDNHTQVGAKSQIPPALPDKASAEAEDPNDTVVTASLDTLATEFEPEMLTTPRRFPKIPWLAIACSLLFSVGLAGQIAFFEFDYLVEDERFRPWYARFCEQAKCELPAQEDFNAIRSTQFVVRVHPTENNALIVDVNIKNQAAFAQPFPAIELRFTDMNGKLVAKRQFAPDEYKRAKLKEIALMPPKRKIHLTLEIVDPGETAKNYELKLHKLAPSPA